MAEEDGARRRSWAISQAIHQQLRSCCWRRSLTRERYMHGVHWFPGFCTWFPALDGTSVSSPTSSPHRPTARCPRMATVYTSARNSNSYNKNNMTRSRRRPRAQSWRDNLASIVFGTILLLSPALASAATHHTPRQPTRELADALAGVDMNALLQQIGQVDCTEDTNSIIRRFFENNKLLFDTCSSDSGYKLYAQGTRLPEAEQTAKLCESPSCMDLLSGVVLIGLPECEYQRYSPRSLAESFIRVRVDIDNNRPPPTASQFGELYVLNRVVNYLTENATIQAAVPTTFNAAEVAPLMNPLERNKDVVISDDYVVYYQETRNTTSSSSGSHSGADHSSSSHKGSASSSSPPSSSSSADEASGNTGDDTDELRPPHNLTMAYVCVGIMWLLVNAFYLWAMSRKFLDD